MTKKQELAVNDAENHRITFVADAPNYVMRKINQQLNEDQESYFMATVKKTKDTDSTKENYYKITPYKTDGYYFVRGEEDLEEILNFLKEKGVGIMKIK